MSKNSKNDKPDMFVPCFNHLLKRYGPNGAAIYGKIWLYEKGRDKECWASKGRMAEELGLSWKTIKRYIDDLVKDGYIFESGKKKGKRSFIYNTTNQLETEVWFQTVAQGDREYPVTGDELGQNADDIGQNADELSQNAEVLSQKVQLIDDLRDKKIDHNNTSKSSINEDLATPIGVDDAVYLNLLSKFEGLLPVGTEVNVSHQQEEELLKLLNTYGEEKCNRVILWVADKYPEDENAALTIFSNALPKWEMNYVYSENEKRTGDNLPYASAQPIARRSPNLINARDLPDTYGEFIEADEQHSVFIQGRIAK